jgi:hypothetical protein
VLFGPEESLEDEEGQAITVTSQRYTEMINEFLAPKLPPNHNLRFQQDGATAHTAVVSMAALCFLFPQRVTTRFGDVPWPSRSPDLPEPDIVVYSYLKIKAYIKRHINLHALRRAIRDEIVNISDETLRQVMRRFLTPAHLSSQESGGHTKDIVHKENTM